MTGAMWAVVLTDVFRVLGLIGPHCQIETVTHAGRTWLAVMCGAR